MGSTTSTIYTIGTALTRAQDNDAQVRILVEGHWLTGQVCAVDGYGLVLGFTEMHGDQMQQSVIRIESISAVQVDLDLPGRARIPAREHAMPGRPAYG